MTPDDADDLAVGLVADLIDKPGPFALLGVPADADGPQLRRAVERQRIAGRVSSGAGPTDEIRAAAQRLADPRVRLAHELLWYRPDPAGDGADRHDLAVGHLLPLLDDERDGDIAAGAEAALAAMQAHLGAAETAAYAARRVQAIGDRRLGQADVAPLLDSLHLVAPTVALRCALRLLRAGDPAGAARIVTAVRSAAPADITRHALERASDPIERSIVARAERVGAMSDHGPDGEQAAVVSRVAAFLDGSADDRAAIDLLLTDDPARRAAVLDRAVSCCLDVLVGWCNDQISDDEPSLALGDRLAGALDLLEQLGQLPCTGIVADRVDHNIDRVSDAVDTCRRAGDPDRCWYCGGEPSADRAASVRLHRDVHRQGRRLTWSGATVDVPRCRACRRAHKRREIIWMTLVLLLFIPVMGLCAFVMSLVFGLGVAIATDRSQTALLGGLPADPIGALTGVALFWLGFFRLDPWFQRRMTVWDRTSAYPPVASALADGWSPGAKPKGVR